MCTILCLLCVIYKYTIVKQCMDEKMLGLIDLRRFRAISSPYPFPAQQNMTIWPQCDTQKVLGTWRKKVFYPLAIPKLPRMQLGTRETISFVYFAKWMYPWYLSLPWSLERRLKVGLLAEMGQKQWQHKIPAKYTTRK